MLQHFLFTMHIMPSGDLGHHDFSIVLKGQFEMGNKYM